MGDNTNQNGPSVIDGKIQSKDSGSEAGVRSCSPESGGSLNMGDSQAPRPASGDGRAPAGGGERGAQEQPVHSQEARQPVQQDQTAQQQPGQSPAQQQVQQAQTAQRQPEQSPAQQQVQQQQTAQRQPGQSMAQQAQTAQRYPGQSPAQQQAQQDQTAQRQPEQSPAQQQVQQQTAQQHPGQSTAQQQAQQDQTAQRQPEQSTAQQQVQQQTAQRQPGQSTAQQRWRPPNPMWIEAQEARNRQDSSSNPYYNQPTWNPYLKDIFSTASLLFGVLSMMFHCLSFFSIPLGSLSILFAILARRTGKRMNQMAATGIVISCLSIISGIIMMVSSLMTLPQNMKNPEFRRQMDFFSEQLYGASFSEMLEEVYGITLDE